MSYAQELASRYTAAHKRLMGLPSPKKSYIRTPAPIKPPPPRIRPTLSPETPHIILKPTLKQLLVWISQKEMINREDIIGPRRGKWVVRPRQVFYYLAYVYSGCSFTQIGRFCNRDHTTVIDGFQRVCGLIKDNALWYAHVREYTDQLDQLVQGECKVCPFCGK